MLYEYEIGGDEHQDRETVQEYDSTAHETGIKERECGDREKERLRGAYHQISYGKELFCRSREAFEYKTGGHQAHDEEGEPKGEPRAEGPFWAGG